MPLIVHLTSILLQILLFCPETDGGSITWFEPPPVETTADTNVIQTYNTSLVEGSTNVELNWNFSLTQDLTFIVLQLQFGSETVASVSQSGQSEISSSFRGRVTVRWIPQKLSLTILKVSTLDNGEFTCTVTTFGGGNKLWSRKIKVTVLVQPKITNVSQDQPIPEGSDLKLFCEASGSPTPNINWTRVFKNGSESEVRYQGPVWNVENISRTDNGSYRCTAYNGVGEAVHHEIHVNVLYPPNIVYLPSYEYRAADLQSVSLECKAEGNPKPSYTWTPCMQNVCNESILVLLEVRFDAVYNCTVENDFGKASAEYRIAIAGNVINVTMTITNKKCIDGKYNQSILSTKLNETMRNIFNESIGYRSTSVNDVRCSSLIVDLALTFSSSVTERSILTILRKAAENGTFGEFTVNASSIVGTRPLIERSTTPPAIKPTTSAPSDKKMIWIIVGAILGAIAMLVIIGVVIWIVRKKKCRKDTKEVSDDKGAGQDKSGPSSGTGNNGYVDSGSAYAQPELSSRPPTKTAGKKEKKPGKKGKDPQPAALPLYAQVDKTKKKPREPENTYDDANDQRRRQPGEVTYTTLDHSDQGASLPRGAANQTSRPPPYTETTYAVLV